MMAGAPWWSASLCMECAFAGKGDLDDLSRAKIERLKSTAAEIASGISTSEDPAIRSLMMALHSVGDSLNYIERYAADILVRDQGPDGKWGSFSLLELPADKAIAHAFRFVRLGQRPHRRVRPAGEEENNG